MDEERLRELGKIYCFETAQQRTERILKKIYDDTLKEIENREIENENSPD